MKKKLLIEKLNSNTIIKELGKEHISKLSDNKFHYYSNINSTRVIKNSSEKIHSSVLYEERTNGKLIISKIYSDSICELNDLQEIIRDLIVKNKSVTVSTKTDTETKQLFDEAINRIFNGHIKPISEMPNNDFLHSTDSLEKAESIFNKGFNKRRFGETARKFGMEHLYQSSPIAVYALNDNGKNHIYDNAFVKFTIKPDKGKNILYYNGDASEFKAKVFTEFECKDSKDMSDIFHTLGITCILPEDGMDEVISLDFKSIIIKSCGINGKETQKTNTKSTAYGYNLN